MAIPIDNINKMRALVGQLLALKAEYDGLRNEYTALDIGNVITDADFEDMTKSQATSAVSNLDTLFGSISSGVDTNLYRFSDGSHRV